MLIVIGGCDCYLVVVVLVIVIVDCAWLLWLLVGQGQTLWRGVTPETALGVMIDL